MKQTLFPIWFRAYFFIPVLAVMYVAIPLFFWNFSPHALTHTMPDFLLGATDWGSGNIYTFTKIAYWIGLVLGAIANSSVVSEKSRLVGVLWWRFRLNAWHIGAAVCLPLMTLPRGINTDSMDMWLLLGYFLLGVFIMMLLLSIAQQRRWPRLHFLFVILAMALAWGFVPVSLGRP